MNPSIFAQLMALVTGPVGLSGSPYLMPPAPRSFCKSEDRVHKRKLRKAAHASRMYNRRHG